ncbi:hypothetical protein [Lactococcus lactis]
MKDYFSQYKFVGDYRLYQIFEPYFKNISQKSPLVPIPISPKRLEERGFNQVTAFLQQDNFIELLKKRIRSNNLALIEKNDWKVQILFD